MKKYCPNCNKEYEGSVCPVCGTNLIANGNVASSYHLMIDNKQYGPYNLQQLKEMIQQGTFTNQTYVWTEGMSQWEMAGNVHNLAFLFQPVVISQPSVNPDIPNSGKLSPVTPNYNNPYSNQYGSGYGNQPQQIQQEQKELSGCSKVIFFVLSILSLGVGIFGLTVFYKPPIEIGCGGGGLLLALLAKNKRTGKVISWIRSWGFYLAWINIIWVCVEFGLKAAGIDVFGQ